MAVVVLENIGYSAVIGNTSAPYINGLARQFGLASNDYANTHPSIGNYFMMTTGVIVSNDDYGYVGPYTGDNLARAFAASGKSWKVYAQSLPSVGYTGGDTGDYIKHHNPFAYFSDVVGTAQANNIVPLTQLASDLSAGRLPDFLFIVPDNAHNGHNCPGGGTDCTDEQRMQVADNWLETLGSLLKNPAFGNGVLVVTFDEANFNDTTNGGGHIAVVLAGGAVKGAFQSNSFMQHQNLLRFVCDTLQLATCPGAGESAANAMNRFLQGQP